MELMVVHTFIRVFLSLFDDTQTRLVPAISGSWVPQRGYYSIRWILGFFTRRIDTRDWIGLNPSRPISWNSIE